MDERHEHEQFFFDDATVDHLATYLQGFGRVCCLCSPLVGQALVERDHPVTILDIDERFSHLPGFVHYDVYRPRWLEQEFDVILCDPPFFKVSLSQLFDAIRMLSHHNWSQRILLAFLQRRAKAVEGTFAKFGLQGTGHIAGYRTVQVSSKNVIEIFANGPEGEGL